MEIYEAQHCIQCGTGSVVEVRVNALRACLTQSRFQVFFLLVVDRRVETKLFNALPDLFLTARDANHVTAFDPGDLANRGPDSPSSSGHYDRLTSGGAAHVQETEVRGQTIQAEDSERQRHRKIRLAQLAHHILSAHRRVVLPSEDAHDLVADQVSGIAGLDDFTYRKGAHRVANFDAGPVSTLVSDPSAHSGIDGQVRVAHEKLTILRHWNRRIPDCEVLGARNAVWPRLQPNLAVDLATAFVLSHVVLPGIAMRCPTREGCACSRRDAVHPAVAEACGPE